MTLSKKRMCLFYKICNKIIKGSNFHYESVKYKKVKNKQLTDFELTAQKQYVL